MVRPGGRKRGHAPFLIPEHGYAEIMGTFLIISPASGKSIRRCCGKNMASSPGAEKGDRYLFIDELLDV